MSLFCFGIDEIRTLSKRTSNHYSRILVRIYSILQGYYIDSEGYSQHEMDRTVEEQASCTFFFRKTKKIQKAQL